MPTLALIAGNGKLPFLVASAYKSKAEHRVVAVGFKGDTDPAIAELVDDFAWIGVGQLGRLISRFKKAGADIKYTRYEGVGHDAWTKTYDNPELYTWFLSHTRKETGGGRGR